MAPLEEGANLKLLHGLLDWFKRVSPRSNNKVGLIASRITIPHNEKTGQYFLSSMTGKIVTIVRSIMG